MATPNAISKSAQSATALILLQVLSRGFTFIVNQILLRYLSPALLGISQQLELFTISVLYFSRESLRVALQRQSIEPLPAAKIKSEDDKISRSSRLQEVINLSYLPIALGPVLATLFAWIYLAKASPESLAVPYIRSSLQLFCLAAIVELTVEPCFAFAAQRQVIRLRVAAETTATLSRCVVTVATAGWASRNARDLGALPFAFGQCAYAAGLWIVYYSYVLRNGDSGFSLLPKSFASSSYILSFFPRGTLSLASNLYAQSGLKHILTQGDSLLITLFADLPSQGIFALASNYGSLLARVVFQPIEESSRSFFGRTLTMASPTSGELKALPKDSLNTVHTYLTVLLKAYSYLAMLLVVLGPHLSAPVLTILAGQRWRSSSAPRILSKYCYYLPLLAYNGLLEAFVSATASPAELRRQSMAMLVFSAVFAAAGYILLGIFDRGVDGILEANMCNMAVRILWSTKWVESWWRNAQRDAEKQRSKEVGRVPDLVVFSLATLPNLIVQAVAFATWKGLRDFSTELTLSMKDMIEYQGFGSPPDVVVDVVTVGVISTPLLLTIVHYEWETFVEPLLQRLMSLTGNKSSSSRVAVHKKKS